MMKIPIMIQEKLFQVNHYKSKKLDLLIEILSINIKIKKIKSH